MRALINYIAASCNSSFLHEADILLMAAPSCPFRKWVDKYDKDAIGARPVAIYQSLAMLVAASMDSTQQDYVEVMDSVIREEVKEDARQLRRAAIKKKAKHSKTVKAKTAQKGVETAKARQVVR